MKHIKKLRRTTDLGEIRNFFRFKKYVRSVSYAGALFRGETHGRFIHLFKNIFIIEFNYKVKNLYL